MNGHLALGSPSLDHASRAARRAIQQAFGSDLLAEHRPTMITPRLTEDADLILVMAHNLLTKTLPLEKTHVLKPFLGFSGDVFDPWPDGDDEETQRRYAECCAELRTILEGHFETIVELLRPSRRASRPTLGRPTVSLMLRLGSRPVPRPIIVHAEPAAMPADTCVDIAPRAERRYPGDRCWTPTRRAR